MPPLGLSRLLEAAMLQVIERVIQDRLGGVCSLVVGTVLSIATNVPSCPMPTIELPHCNGELAWGRANLPLARLHLQLDTRAMHGVHSMSPPLAVFLGTLTHQQAGLRISCCRNPRSVAAPCRFSQGCPGRPFTTPIRPGKAWKSSVAGLVRSFDL